MNEPVQANLMKYLDQQLKKFLNTFFINLIFLLGLVILWAINLYSSIKDVNNSAPDRILIYDALIFITSWVVWTIIKNLLGYRKGKQLQDLVQTSSHQPAKQLKLLNFPLHWLFYGSYYHLIEQELSLFIGRDYFHQAKKQQNLRHLNWKLALISVALVLTGVGFFVSMVIYFRSATLADHWQLVFTLSVMIAFCLVVFGFSLPRQLVLNQKVKLNNQNQIDENDYFDQQRYFAFAGTLTKLWSPHHHLS